MADPAAVIDAVPAPAPAPAKVAPLATLPPVAPEAGKGTVLTDAAKVEPAKVDEVKPPAKVIPDKYEFKLADGASALYDKHIEEVSAFAKEHKMSMEEAQAVFDHEHKVAASFVEGQRKSLSEQSVAWVDQLRSDKEFGGANFAQNAELAKRGLSFCADPELKKVLDETGLGNHPLLVKAFWKVGKALGDDKFVTPGATPSKPRTHEETMFPIEELIQRKDDIS